MDPNTGDGVKDDAPSAIELAEQALRRHDLEGAETIVRGVLEEQPGSCDALALLAEVARRCGEFGPAEELAGAAYAGAPRSARVVRVAAALLADTGRLAEGAALLGDLDALIGVDAETHRTRGALLGRLGRLPEAVAAHEEAARCEPNEPSLLAALGQALGEAGDHERAAATLARAHELRPEDPATVVNAAAALARGGRRTEARALLDDATGRWPAFAPGHAHRGEFLVAEGELDAGIAALERAWALDPAALPVITALGRAHIRTGAASSAISLVERALATRPGHSGLIALAALALEAAGRREEARALRAEERFVTTSRIAPPAPFPSVASFNEALVAHVLAHPSLAWAPASHATAHGLHSGSLLTAPKGPMAAFENMVESALAAYVRALPVDDAHAFVAQRPRAVCLDVWAVVLERGGHQLPHIHPDAWLSGVYYAALPPPSGDETDGSAGALELGRADDPALQPLAPDLRVIHPEEGLLVLFPSYVLHRTVPFTRGGRRVSVAFDVVPLPR